MVNNKKIKRTLSKTWPFIVIVLISILFHVNLFLPKPSIYITPDYGRSDLVHSKLPTQYIMWKNLHQGTLPLWEKNVYQGYPVLDGLEMGFYYFQNLILFGTLPFWIAFNLGYISNAIIVALGTFLLARSFRLNRLASLVAALTFAYSPIFTLHYHHYNLILGMAAIPWLYWLINSFYNTRRFVYLAIFPLVLSQQYFAGSPQIPTYNLFFLISYFIFKLKQEKIAGTAQLKIFLVFLAVISFGFILASAQILPAYYLTKTSRWFSDVNPQAILTQFPFKYTNLLTMLDPYILGNPKIGSYPIWNPGNWGIFWESNAYFGLIQLSLVILSILILLRKKFNKYKKNTITFLTFFLIGIILSLGQEAPLHPIFSIPPFSFFRVPSRFLFISFFSASILSAFSLDYFQKNNKVKRFYPLLASVLILFICLDIARVWFPYNMTGEINKWLAKPPIASTIESNRILSAGQNIFWNETFNKFGWQNREEDYYFYRNFLTENLNLMFDLSSLYGYESIIPNRIRFIEQLSKSQLKPKNNEFEIGPVSEKVLDFSNVRYVTLPSELKSENWKKIDSITNNGKRIYLYENNDYLHNAYTVNNYKIATSREAFSQILSDENYVPKETVILEKDINIEQSSTNPVASKVELFKKNNTKVEIHADSPKQSILILSDSYYDGWTATVNGHRAEIFPANINSRAVVIPAGKSITVFNYSPTIVLRSALVSLISLIICIFAIYKAKSKNF